MTLYSRNPATGEEMESFSQLTEEELSQKISLAQESFEDWKKKPLKERVGYLKKLAEAFEQKTDYLSMLGTLEMGMPITQGNSEIEKAVKLINYYADNAESILADEQIETDNKESYVKYEPLGILLHVAPWNFPFYLALRPVIPAIVAGNTVLLKHSSNVPQCSKAIEEMFDLAGFDKGVFQSLLIGSKLVEPIVRDDRVVSVSLIGSEKAGSKVASAAGEEIKPTVMELGGSDPFIVLKDADMDKVFPAACNSRMRNCGQSCNAAKRFIVDKSVLEEFLTKFKTQIEQEVVGDPLERETTIGPLATESSLQDIRRQVEESVKMGAKVIFGGHGDFAVIPEKWKTLELGQGYYYLPTLLSEVSREMPVFREEVFGPVASVLEVDGVEEAIQAANDSKYGLGSSIWTENYDLAKDIISRIEAGNVFINSMVRSNIKMPYGGIKKSGYGREMGEYGLLEFVNIKTVVFKD
jgi:succinate-semialdehyde dehydrogenase / glutarate-semialdehyde dehydrogenase